MYDILDADKLVLTQGAVDYLNQRYGGDYEGSDDEDEEEEEEGYEEGEEEGVVDGEEGPDAGDSDVVN